ncbi:uncharacterized protein LOC129718453 [Wyeomyia smithii]|uniref:uncharacterized protein LOC129718453 n=1 Tax=Wyeomyia smithii TaxID=174621 RepID=UPI002467D92B|nr:uncharacterized protein LOC129718453 [Wyeomyia smithii]
MLKEIFAVFPHLKSYNGVMIQKTYERMNPTLDRESNQKKVLVRGLLIENETLATVGDDNLRGCLRILVPLSRKGVKSQAGIECLSAEEPIAAPLVRWISINQHPFQNNKPNTSHGIWIRP